MDTKAEPPSTETASTPVHSSELLSGIRDLDRSDTEWLLERYAATEDPTYAEAVITIHRPLALSRARKMRRPEVEMDDLIQVAMAAMWKAIQRFSPDKGAAFSTYAVRTIDGDLKRYYRDRVWAMRVPRGLKNLSLKVTRARKRYVAQHGSEPTIEQLADFADLSVDDVREGLAAAQGYSTSSLDKPVGDGRRPLGEFLIDDKQEDGFDREMLLDVMEHINDLPERSRRIIHLRFFEDMTQREIAEEVGCSQMHVSRLLRRSLTKLRHELT